MPVKAVQHVRRMRGGAQSHLMRADDGRFYVVKFRNNPQHIRVLANELLATRLAEAVGLPVAGAEVVWVDDWLIKNTPELTIQLARQTAPCVAGLQFGSRYVADPLASLVEVFDFLPETMLGRVRNVKAFAGMLAFDKWTCNCNGRQVAFWRQPRERKFTATFIDHGYCFNAGEWTFPDAPLLGVYGRNSVYAGIAGWDAFEPWLARIETLDESGIAAAAESVPVEWYGNWDDMGRLVERLARRRGRVRELIEDFRRTKRDPFPNWYGGAAADGGAGAGIVM